MSYCDCQCMHWLFRFSILHSNKTLIRLCINAKLFCFLNYKIFLYFYKYVNISDKFNFWSVHGIMNTLGLLQSYMKPFGLHLLCKRPEVFKIS